MLEVLGPRADVSQVGLRAQAFGLQLIGHLLRGLERLLLRVLGDDRDDHDLHRRDRRRHHEPAVVPVDRHDGAQQALAHPIGRLVRVLARAVGILEGDPVRLREIVAVVVDRGHLEGLARRRDRVGPQRVERAGELVPLRAPVEQVRQRQFARQGRPDFHVLAHLRLGGLEVLLRRVALEEVDLAHAHERARHLGLIAECVDDLEDLEREVRVAADPQREHRVHRGL